MQRADLRDGVLYPRPWLHVPRARGVPPVRRSVGPQLHSRMSRVRGVLHRDDRGVYPDPSRGLPGSEHVPGARLELLQPRASGVSSAAWKMLHPEHERRVRLFRCHTICVCGGEWDWVDRRDYLRPTALSANRRRVLSRQRRVHPGQQPAALCESGRRLYGRRDGLRYRAVRPGVLPQWGMQPHDNRAMPRSGWRVHATDGMRP